MTTTRRRIAAALLALATVGGIATVSAAPTEAASYRTAVGGPWASFAYCRAWVASQTQTHPGSYGLCAQTTYQGRSGIYSVMNYPLRSNG